MKYSILFLAFLATPVFAQSTAGSSSASSSKAALSASQGNAQTLIVQSAAIPASTNVHYSGLDRSAPTNVTGGFAAGFSSDNCSNTAQVGGSGPGFSVNVGKAVPDKNCAVMRHIDAHVRIASGYAAMGYTNAALYQLDQAAIDDCIADGYAEDGCRKIRTQPVPAK
jgi:hypothetical protein